MAAEHYTPGPWTTKVAPTQTDGATDFAILDSDRKIIAEVFGRVSEYAFRPSAANADLIARAPELLAEVASLRQEVEQQQRDAYAHASRIVLRLIEEGAISEDDEGRRGFVAAVALELTEIFSDVLARAAGRLP